MDGTRSSRTRGWFLWTGASALTILLLPVVAAAQTGTGLPFGSGERLTYHISVDKLGASGSGTMWIEGPTEVRGSSALLLRSAVEVGVGPVKVIDQTDSWFDPVRMTALRFEQRHRYLFSRSRAGVEMYPDEMRWEGSRGAGGTSPTAAPLDELSFIYYVRTLSLESDTTYAINRHYDAERNPVNLRNLGRDTLRVALGDFPIVIVELRVKDPRRFTGDGVIRLFLTDDADRIPVRIESMLPGLGSAVFSLESFTRTAVRSTAGQR